MTAKSPEITHTLETGFAYLIYMVQQLDIKIPILTACKLARIISYVHDNEMIYINKGILYCLATVLRNLNLGNMSKFPNQLKHSLAFNGDTNSVDGTTGGRCQVCYSTNRMQPHVK